MSHLNVTLNGNLIADPYLKVFQSGANICKFRIATSRRKRTGEVDAKGREVWEDTDQLFIDVECWNQVAVNARASLFKGAPVVVTGRLVTESWIDKIEKVEDGEEVIRYRTLLKADRVAFDLAGHQLSSWKVADNGHTLEGQPPVKIKSAEDFLSDAEREQLRLAREEAQEAIPDEAQEHDLVGARSSFGAVSEQSGVAQEEGAPF